MGGLPIIEDGYSPMTEPVFEELYTETYVQIQLNKFQNRYENHWKAHLDLAEVLVKKYAPAPPARMLDLGCSIGTFAIEYALKGYTSAGLDLDEKSLEQGQNLAKELGISVAWIKSDATDFVLNENVDFIICFDLLEHLFDDQIHGMLASVNRALAPGGVFLFHTFPTQYDHIFYRNNVFPLPLVPFCKLPSQYFTALTRGYAALIDGYYLLRRGKTWKNIIKQSVHPNPLSLARMRAFCEQAGLDVELLDSGLDSVNALKPNQGRIASRYFKKQPVAMRSIWGVARKPFEREGR
jgi:2-polyprenyl-3-methyl-5-hydroxy-6-metoxy-1,4-benzoquinol methylase